MSKLFARTPRKESEGEPASRGAQGISVGGNALQAALIPGLLVVLLPLLLLGAWQLLLRDPEQRQTLLQQVVDDQARQLAAQLEQRLQQLRRQLRDVAATPELDTLGADSSAESLAGIEARIHERLPDTLSTRVLPIGDLGLSYESAGLAPLRNHIEIDLAQHAAAEETAGPEAYRIDGRWFVSMAQRQATDGEQSTGRAVLLQTLDEAALRRLLPAPGGEGGQLILRQRFANRSNDVISAGSAPTDAPQAIVDIPDTNWQLLHRPSESLIGAVLRNTRPAYELFGGLLLACIVGFGLVRWRLNRVLEREVERARAAADTRAPVTLQVPALVPLAQELRKLTLRKSRPGASTSRPVAGAPTSSSVATSVNDGSIEGPTAVELPAMVFRAYDIRGLADEQLDDETVYRIGCAVAALAEEVQEQTLVLACDGRRSSPRIKAVLEKALLRSGRDVVDIGLVPTPLMYFATQRADCSSGIMVTGSHNPREYNGMKIVLKSRSLAAGAIARLRDVAQKGDFPRGNGRRMQRDVVGDYLDEICGDIAIAMPLKIVVDAGNGATAAVAPVLLEELGCEVVPLFCEVDGDFPNRSPDTGNEANLRQLVEKVLETQADFGVAFDGDGDRIAVVTGSGRILRTDILMMLLARDVVSRNPGADVVYDVKCTRNLAQLISSLGGRPILCRTGHAPMKEKMAETGALVGGEFSGHVFFGERWYGFDDGMYACARLAEILAAQSATLDELLANLPISVSTPEILVPVPEEEKFALVERFVEQAQFPDGKMLTLDGLRVDFNDGWGLLRASNTTPALTARFEATNQTSLENIMSRFREQLNAVAPSLEITF